MVNILTLIVIFLSAYLLYLFKGRSNPRSLPGPKGYPVVGNLFDISMNTIHIKFFELSKTFGDVFQISICGIKLVVLNSADVLRDLFIKEPNATLTAGRPETFSGKYVWKLSEVVFSSTPTILTQRRKYLHRALHTYGKDIRTLAGQFTNSLSNLSVEITESNGKPVDPLNLIDEYILATLQILLVGKVPDNNDLSKEIKEFNISANEAAKISNDILFSFFPFLRYTSLPGAKALKNIMEKKSHLLKTLDKVAKDYPNHKGVYQHMLKSLQDSDTEWFTEENLVAFIGLDIIVAGYITTKNMLSSLVRVLLSSPETQRKLQNEIDAVIGRDRKPELEDRYAMPFTEAVTLETYRYISHVPTTGLHKTTDDIEYRGYHIPKGTTIIANTWSAHHSEKDWTLPFKFDPGRFLDEDGQVFAADHQTRKNVLIFGMGKRACIGEVFAKTRIFLFLTHLMQAFTLAPEDGKVPPPMISPYDMCPGGVLQPPEFKCKFVKRD